MQFKVTRGEIEVKGIEVSTFRDLNLVRIKTRPIRDSLDVFAIKSYSALEPAVVDFVGGK